MNDINLEKETPRNLEKMMHLLAPIENIRFDIEDALEKQISIVPLPFDGMDSEFNYVSFYF